MTLNQCTLGFLGGGHMTRALIGGLCQPALGLDPQNIKVFDRNPPKNEALKSDFAIHVSPSPMALAADCDVLIVSVRPQGVTALLHDLAGPIAEKKPLILSVAAGITLDTLEQSLPANTAVIRTMPNMPSIINQGATGLLANHHASEAQKHLAESLMNAVGSSVWVNDDAQMNAVTALSGSGPAYGLLLAQAMMEAGEQLGLSPDAARSLAIQTCQGTAQLMATSEHSVTDLIEHICSPNGTTERAVGVFRQEGFNELVARALKAAYERAEALSR